MIKVEFSGENSVEVHALIRDFAGAPNASPTENPKKLAAATAANRAQAAPTEENVEQPELTHDQARTRITTFARENSITPAVIKEFLSTWSKGKATSVPQIPVKKLAEFIEAFEAEHTAY